MSKIGIALEFWQFLKVRKKVLAGSHSAYASGFGRLDGPNRRKRLGAFYIRCSNSAF